MQCQERTQKSEDTQLLELTRHRRRRSGYKEQAPCFLAIPTTHCESGCLFQLPRKGSARTRQLPHPRTCGHKSQEHATGSEGAKSKHPRFCSPRPRKLRQGTAARRTGRQGRAKASGGETNALAPEDTARTRALLPRPPPRQGRDRGNRLATRSHEKQSHVAVTERRRLLDRGTCWRTGRRIGDRRGKRRERGTRGRRALRCLEAGSGGRTRRGASRAAASSAPTPPCRRRCRPAAPRRRVADPLVPWVSSRCRASSSGGSVSSL